MILYLNFEGKKYLKKSLLLTEILAAISYNIKLVEKNLIARQKKPAQMINYL